MSLGRRRGALGVAAVAALLVGAAVPSPSSAVTFGTDLSRVPDNTTACNEILFFNPIPTCSTTSNDPTTGEQLRPPVGRGIVTTVRVKVGPVTGPMQVVVQQALRADNPSSPGNPTYACCQAIRTSQVFTPAANATTTVKVNLPIRQDLAPDPASGLYTDQHLALSVLAANVPIPAASSPNSGYSVFLPAWQAGEERAGPFSGLGAAVTLSADWQSCGKSGKAALSAKKKRKKKKSRCGKKRRKKRKKK
jgi:hypothetical protein